MKPSLSEWCMIVAAICLRIALVEIGIGRYLTTRIEVSTPSNGMLPAKEGIFLISNGVSPYSGSACRTPPLILSLSSFLNLPQQTGYMRNFEQSDCPYVTLPIVADVAASLLLRSVMVHGSCNDRWLIAGPAAVMAVYLFNPFTVMSSIAGTVTSIENLCIMAALYASCKGRIILTAVALACCAYLGLYPILLLVPMAILLVHGPEISMAAETSAVDVDVDKCGQNPEPLEPSPVSESCPAREATISVPQRSVAATCLLLTGATALSLLGLLACSDVALWAFPDDQCLPLIGRCMLKCLSTLTPVDLARGRFGLGSGLTGTQPPSFILDTSAASSCWAGRVYGLLLLIQDLTPNIGQWWYFFAQIFPAQRAFFAFVAHILCALFAVPAALRFPRRGLLLSVIQLGASTMLRPYPSLGDLGLYLSVLLLLQPQLQRFKSGLLLSNSLLLLAVLGPAMWHQWIDAESANANFFYSITLLLGAWHALLLILLVLSTLDIEQTGGLIASSQRAVQPGTS